MLSEKEMSLLYETLLSAPGMAETVKLDLRMPRKNVLLLAKIIEKGIQAKNAEVEELVHASGEGSVEALQQTVTELLSKAGLTDMHARLNSLRIK